MTQQSRGEKQKGQKGSSGTNAKGLGHGGDLTIRLDGLNVLVTSQVGEEGIGDGGREAAHLGHFVMVLDLSTFSGNILHHLINDFLGSVLLENNNVLSVGHGGSGGSSGGEEAGDIKIRGPYEQKVTTGKGWNDQGEGGK